MPAGQRICFRARRGYVGGGHVISVAMKAMISSIMIALAAALLGCVAFRVSGPLPLKRQPQGYTVLLGVRDEDVRSDSEPREKLQKIADKVLNRLGSGRKSRLIAPAQMEVWLRTNGFGPGLLYFDGDGGFTNRISGDVQEELLRAGFRRVVQTQISFVEHRVTKSQDLALYTWGGKVTARMKLAGLAPPVELGEAEISVEYSQTAGEIAGFPIYMGETLGHATDEAIEKALQWLLRKTAL